MRLRYFVMWDKRHEALEKPTELDSSMKLSYS